MKLDHDTLLTSLCSFDVRNPESKWHPAQESGTRDCSCVSCEEGTHQLATALIELSEAVDRRREADLEIDRLNKYPRKNDGMKADLRAWYDRLDAANEVIHRINKIVKGT